MRERRHRAPATGAPRRLQGTGLADLPHLGAGPAEQRLHRRAAGRDPRRHAREAAQPAVPRHSSDRALGWRAGTALDGVPPELPEEPQVLRRLHRPERKHARRRVPVERRGRDEAPAAVALRAAAVRQPQRRAAPVRPGRAPLRRHGRRRLGGRPREPRAEPLEPPRQAAVDQRRLAQALGGDRRLRAAQPVALLLRQVAATSTSATSGRTPGRRSTTRRARAPGSRTTAGTSTRGRTPTSPRPRTASAIS